MFNFTLVWMLLLAAVPVYFLIQQSSALPSNAQIPAATDGITVKEIRLVAREHRSPPVGVPIEAHRNIGFADVFLTIENDREEAGDVMIEKIRIEDMENREIPIEDDVQQQIAFNPLEHSVNDFHLTNKFGYREKARVKAVVTYQVNRQSYTMESDVMEVNRY
jgi:hypothetical protein